MVRIPSRTNSCPARASPSRKSLSRRGITKKNLLHAMLSFSKLHERDIAASKFSRDKQIAISVGRLSQPWISPGKGCIYAHSAINMVSRVSMYITETSPYKSDPGFPSNI